MGKDRNCISGLAFTVNQKLKKNRIYKVRKGDGKNQILQLARFRSEKPNENETGTLLRMMVLNQELGSKFD